jgi:hypothetical protein
MGFSVFHATYLVQKAHWQFPRWGVHSKRRIHLVLPARGTPSYPGWAAMVRMASPRPGPDIPRSLKPSSILLNQYRPGLTWSYSPDVIGWGGIPGAMKPWSMCMWCSHPQCTGHHDRNHWEGICPRIKEAGLARERERYARQTWLEHHANQLRVRRLKAIQRMERRALEQVQVQGRD